VKPFEMLISILGSRKPMGTVFPEARDAAMSLVGTSDNVALKNGRGGKFIITLTGVDIVVVLIL
jgi:hypothetical protein